MPTVRLCEWSETGGDDFPEMYIGVETEVDELPQKGGYIVHDNGRYKTTFRVDFRVMWAGGGHAGNLPLRVAVTEVAHRGVKNGEE